MIAANFKLPAKNIVISIGPMSAKTEFVATGAAKQLQDMGFTLYATKSTHEHFGCTKGFFFSITRLSMGVREKKTWSFKEVQVQDELDLYLS